MKKLAFALIVIDFLFSACTTAPSAGQTQPNQEAISSQPTQVTPCIFSGNGSLIAKVAGSSECQEIPAADGLDIGELNWKAYSILHSICIDFPTGTAEIAGSPTNITVNCQSLVLKSEIRAEFLNLQGI